MSRSRRRILSLAALAATFGLGVGLLASDLGVVMPGIGLWVAILAGVATAAVVATTPSSPSNDEADADRVGWMEFQRELRRARRHGRPLTLVRIPGPDQSDPRELDAAARRIGVRLRLIDRSWAEEGSIYLMLPESPGTETGAVVERIRAILPDAATAGIRVASFPADGLTSGAIIAAVHDAASDRAPVAIRPAVRDPLGYALDDEVAVGEFAGRR